MPPVEAAQRTAVLLQRMQDGESAAADELFVMLYEQLHSQARLAMGADAAAHTLQPTAVVHEMWVRLARGAPVLALSRQHFLRIAAQAIRRVLVDHARQRGALRRGGGGVRLPLDDALQAWSGDGTLDPIVLDELLERLRSRDARAAEVVELRFFGGLTEEECAELMGLSRRQVQLAWRLARGFLQRELERGEHGV